MEHDEIYENNWGKKENVWLPDLKKNFLSTAFSSARYTLAMEELTGFGMKNSLISPSSANFCLNGLRDEIDEPIHHTDPL